MRSNLSRSLQTHFRWNFSSLTNVHATLKVSKKRLKKAHIGMNLDRLVLSLDIEKCREMRERISIFDEESESKGKVLFIVENVKISLGSSVWNKFWSLKHLKILHT